jgi:hypothetical protein
MSYTAEQSKKERGAPNPDAPLPDLPFRMLENNATLYFTTCDRSIDRLPSKFASPLYIAEM